MEYLKKANADPQVEDQNIRDTVEHMLKDIETRREDAVIEYAQLYDDWKGDFVLSDKQCRTLISGINENVKADIDFAHKQVTRFAIAQRNSLNSFEIEGEPGVRLGQRVIPVSSAGCYVPGGRYAHAASAIMSVGTAKVAEVSTITACSPPRRGTISASAAYAMTLSGADMILQMGGVHAIATMAFGLFDCQESDILVGPGNAYVAEAKRILFGRVGIDLFAGPTESAIIADDTADPMTIAIDLISQAEHGPTSPVWLFTTSRRIGKLVGEILPAIASDMPNSNVVLLAWHDYGEIVACDSRDEALNFCNRYSPEHVQVMADDLEWWKDNLTNYGSLFLGEGSTVTHGDKCSGTNHILPTKRAGRYTGGLNVQKFLKILTYQHLDVSANKVFSAAGSRISRMEGMEGHARACDWRLQKYFPNEEWSFEVYKQRNHPS